jgi:serpin B
MSGRLRTITCLCLAACAALAMAFLAGLASNQTAHAGAPVQAFDIVGSTTPTEAFGLDLLGAGPKGNLVVSPESVATALAMAGSGAAGDTAEQIARTLELKGPARFDTVGNLETKLLAAQAAAAEGKPDAPTFEMANGLFAQQGLALKQSFVDGLAGHFGAAPESVDFAGDPIGALGTINGWGSEHTHGVIPEMLPELPGEAKLVLTNAVYLKAKWKQEFKESNTFPAPFYRADGEWAQTEFMHQTKRLLYGAGPGYEAVELPYKASTLSLLVVLPTDGGVAGLEDRLRETKLGGVALGLSPETVKLSLPRFNLRTETDLTGELEKLGMTVPFSEAADFSGITQAPPLKIAAVEHIADIEVDEEGTEAAATTGVTMVERSKPMTRRKFVTFKADHPFLFFVRDDESGAVLFAGRFTAPTG